MSRFNKLPAAVTAGVLIAGSVAGCANGEWYTPEADRLKIIDASAAERYAHDFSNGMGSTFVGQICMRDTVYAEWRVVVKDHGDGKIDVIPTGKTGDHPGLSPEQVAESQTLKLRIKDEYHALEVRDDDQNTHNILRAFDCKPGELFEDIPQDMLKEMPRL